MSLENSVLMMQGVFEQMDKDFTVWEYRQEIKDLLDYAMNNISHCKDCCCAKALEALEIKEYDGLSIPEHIEKLKRKGYNPPPEIEKRPQKPTPPPPRKEKR